MQHSKPVAFDPESFITGAEAAAGATFLDVRQWPDQNTAERAYSGDMTPNEIARVAPRRAGTGGVSEARPEDVVILGGVTHRSGDIINGL